MDEQDFIVSELLSELKEENKRKDVRIRQLQKTLARVVTMALVAVVLIISAFLLYLNQYDFSSSEEWNIEKSAEGTFALVDSSGNTFGSDQEVMFDGESDGTGN